MLSGGLLPSLAQHDFGNGAVRYSKSIGYITLKIISRCIHCADFSDYFSRQLGHAVAFSWARYQAALLDLIIHVVLRCAEEKVIWFNADRIVAIVQYHHPVRNKDLFEVHEAPPVCVNVVSPSVAETSVSSGLYDRAGPQPTRFRLVDLVEKALNLRERPAASMLGFAHNLTPMTERGL